MTPGGTRARGAGLVVVGLALTLTAPGPSPADLDLVTITLDAPAKTTLGEPLLFAAIVENRAPVAVTGTIAFSVTRGDRDVTFERWSGRMDALSTGQVDLMVTSAQWFADPGEFELQADGTFVPEAAQQQTVSSPEATHTFDVDPAKTIVPKFRDVTRNVGLGTRHRDATDCNNHAAGAAWGDVDDDGDLDLFLPHRKGEAELFINRDGHFVERARRAGVTNGGRMGNGAVFADYDNDGDQDLYVVNNGRNRLYRNRGDGTFADVTRRARVGDDGPGTSASWGDYDADGHLDLYVTNHGRRSNCMSMEFKPFPDALYHNRGDGTFRKVNEILPLGGKAGDGLGFQAAWLDYDGDDDLDLYLANDRIRPGKDRANILWRNDGAGGAHGWKFTDVSKRSGAGIAQNSMGLGAGDYDRDGDLDIALSNMMETALLRNDGKGGFDNVAGDAGVARPMQDADEMSITWGLAFADLNNDGWEDLAVGAGDLETSDGKISPQPNAVFVNDMKGGFLDVSAASGAADPTATRGIALADYDRDGRMDIYAVNQAGRPKLYRNVTPRKDTHWLEVEVMGTRGSNDACGARVVADLGGGTSLVRQVFCGSVSLASGCDRVLHFGLGTVSTVRSLTVEWPSGARETLSGVPADRLMRVGEPVPAPRRATTPPSALPEVRPGLYKPAPAQKQAPGLSGRMPTGTSMPERERGAMGTRKGAMERPPSSAIDPVPQTQRALGPAAPMLHPQRTGRKSMPLGSPPWIALEAAIALTAWWGVRRWWLKEPAVRAAPGPKEDTGI